MKKIHISKKFASKTITSSTYLFWIGEKFILQKWFITIPALILAMIPLSWNASAAAYAT